jgi:predicted nucleic acid-binding protein
MDTNILLRLAQPNHAMHQAAVSAIITLRRQQTTLFIIPQNLIEFWAAATRPLTVNGLGMSTTGAAKELARMKSFFALQPDLSEIFTVWELLVVKYQVLGKQTHDTRLVAAMLAHQISHLLTFNTDDFKRFAEITAIDPRHIAV